MSFSANELHPAALATLERGLDASGDVTVDADGRLPGGIESP